MYGSCYAEDFVTPCYYIGIMQGEVFIGDILEKRPFVYFVPAGIVSQDNWSAPSMKKRVNFYIECRGERVRRFFESVGAEKSFQYKIIRDPAVFTAVFEKMQKIFNSTFVLNKAELAFCFEEFVFLFENEKKFAETKPYYDDFERFASAVRRNPGIPYDLQKEADKLGVTLRHWNRLFRKYMQMPPHTFICKCKLAFACKLLKDRSIPVKNIAVECGFSNVSDFSRFFKKQSGMTPGTYRKSGFC